MDNSNSESSTLFVADIPFNLDEHDFITAFQACEGFLGARLRTDRNENVVGFVDFTDHESAALARERLQGYKFSMADDGLTIHFSHGSRLKRTRDTEEGGYRSSERGVGVGSPVTPPAIAPMLLPLSGGVGMPHAELAGALPFYSPIPNASFPSYNSLTYPTLPPEAVSTLYVEGLPLDATEREVSHIFRPWPGFLSLRILPKESKQYPNRTYNLCFVEFDNKYQATMALHALQGYKMDKNDSKGLNISYAKTARKERRKQPSQPLSPDQPSPGQSQTQSQTQGPSQPSAQAQGQPQPHFNLQQSSQAQSHSHPHGHSHAHSHSHPHAHPHPHHHPHGHSHAHSHPHSHSPSPSPVPPPQRGEKPPSQQS